MRGRVNGRCQAQPVCWWLILIAGGEVDGNRLAFASVSRRRRWAEDSPDLPIGQNWIVVTMRAGNGRLVRHGNVSERVYARARSKKGL